MSGATIVLILERMAGVTVIEPDVLYRSVSQSEFVPGGRVMDGEVAGGRVLSEFVPGGRVLDGAS